MTGWVGWVGWVLAGQASTLVRMPPGKELRSHSEVVALLRPREDFIYLCDVPERDAWGERIEAYYEEEKMLTGRVVTVRSSGANRRIDSDVYEVGGFLPGGATDDIVISDKRFVRWPLGVARTELQVEPKIGRCPEKLLPAREGTPSGWSRDAQARRSTARKV